MPIQQTATTAAEVECLSSSGSYKATVVIGKGASCTCYEVSDLKTCRKMACKIMRGGRFGSLSAQKEHEMLRCMNHDNILRSVDFYIGNDHAYLYTELCERGTLKTFVEEEHPLPGALTQHLLYQAFGAIDYLHGRGIVHRDIKPDNFFLTKDLNVKLGDFGFAMETKFLPKEWGRIMGTRGFMAPEVAEGKRFGCEVDIWSFGCVVYFMLTNRYLVMPTYATQTIYKIPTNVNVCGEDLIRRLLRTKPAERLTREQIKSHPYFKSGTKWHAEFDEFEEDEQTDIMKSDDRTEQTDCHYDQDIEVYFSREIPVNCLYTPLAESSSFDSDSD